MADQCRWHEEAARGSRSSRRRCPRVRILGRGLLVPRRQVVGACWPTDGPSKTAYNREKSYVERLLDIFEHEHQNTRAVRFRPAFVFERSAAAERRLLYGGPFLPGRLLDPRFVPAVPVPSGFHRQTAYSENLARALAGGRA